MSGELFKQLAGIDMVHVPYRGRRRHGDRPDGRAGAARLDVLTGRLPHIQAGTIRAIAFAGRSRYPVLPDVPTIGETDAALRRQLVGRRRRAARHAARDRGAAQPRDQRRLADPGVKARLADGRRRRCRSRPTRSAPMAGGRRWTNGAR